MMMSRTRNLLLALMIGTSLGVSGPALALESIGVPDGVEVNSGEAASEGCPQLTRLKYPFLSCSKDENGNTTLTAFGTGYAAAVENHDDFVLGNGYWDGLTR